MKKLYCRAFAPHLACAAFGLVPQSTRADIWPARTVHVVIPFSPGMGSLFQRALGRIALAGFCKFNDFVRYRFNKLAQDFIDKSCASANVNLCLFSWPGLSSTAGLIREAAFRSSNSYVPDAMRFKVLGGALAVPSTR